VIIIDPEFKALIPPLSTDELAGLEANLIADGCRDPLVVWGEILIDGHNRYAICERMGIDYRTIQRTFKDREAAADWIDANQLGRRNLSPDAFKLLLGRRYNRSKKAANDGGRGTAKRSVHQIEGRSTAQKLGKQHGVSKATVERAGKFAEQVEKVPELKKAITENRPVLQVKRELKEQHREARRQENAAKIERADTPTRIVETAARFATILIDPPWDWGDEGDNDQLGRAKPDYATMSIDELPDLPVAKLADQDCHVYMWITNRSMPKGFGLLNVWGFRFITILTWPKTHFGMGNYFRGQTEHILFGVKGSQMLRRKNASTLLPAWKRGKGGHSSKPAEIYEFIESCSPGPYLEMFSRSERKGWKAWGENSYAA
jgi:N6-adenosine-specific RNA methylase IME4